MHQYSCPCVVLIIFTECQNTFHGCYIKAYVLKHLNETHSAMFVLDSVSMLCPVDERLMNYAEGLACECEEPHYL